MQSADRWNTSQDVPLLLALVNADGTAATGKAPTVAIRRYRETHGPAGGGALDLQFWNGVGFVAGPVAFTMSEVTGSPGVYRYVFEQTLIGLEHQYLCYFSHDVAPVGFAKALHIITDEIQIPTTQPDPIVVGPTSVMGQLELIKDGGGGDFDAATDSLHDLAAGNFRILGLLHHNAMLDQQVHDANGDLTGARLRVFDGPSNVPAAPGGSETTGLQQQYSITATYAAAGIIQSFTLKTVL